MSNVGHENIGIAIVLPDRRSPTRGPGAGDMTIAVPLRSSLFVAAGSCCFARCGDLFADRCWREPRPGQWKSSRTLSGLHGPSIEIPR